MAKNSIYVYSPSGAVTQQNKFELAVKRLQQHGFTLEIDETALTVYQRFAGTDKQRIASIYRAANSKAAIVMPTRGGYGLSRILPQLDFSNLSNSFRRQTWLGFSDLSAFQAAAYQQVKGITWGGYMLLADFATETEPGQEKYEVLTALTEQTFSVNISWLLPQELTTEINCAGVLWGGNLAVLTNLIATPFLPPVQNGILYFEDVGETPYRVERMLLQWLYSGILERQKAIIFGQFSDYAELSSDEGFGLAEVINNLRRRLDVPILTDLPFGHVTRECLLPFGKEVIINTNGKKVYLTAK